MKLLELRTRIQERLASAGGTPYTATEVDRALNEGLWLFSLATLCVERQADLVLRADEPQRRICEKWPDFLAPLRVVCVRRAVTVPGATFDGSLWDSLLWDQTAQFTEVTSAVRPARLRELAALDPAWQLARAGTVERYSVQGIDLLSVYPTPSDENTALRMTYAAQAQTLAFEDQEPEIPQEYHPSLISYALATLPLGQGGSELARFSGEWQEFLNAARECAQWIRARSRGRGYDTQPFAISLPEPKKTGGAK